MKIFFATDHSGLDMKNMLLEFVRDDLGYDVHDCGAFEHDAQDDYPEFISLATREVSLRPETSRAIILGGSGQGEAIVANRFPNVRAVVYYGEPKKMQVDAGGKELGIIASAREHNDANVLSLGARFLTNDEAKSAVKLWLETDFSGEERHIRRIKQIENLLKDDFDIWNTVKKETHKRGSKTPNFRTRDIFYIRMGKNIGVETNGKNVEFRRPVLILKKFNKDMFLGAPLTTSVKHNAWYQHPVNVVGRKGAIVMTQMRVFDSKRLSTKLCTMHEDEFISIMKKVGKLIAFRPFHIIAPN